jgi:hypothetical protein
MDETLLAILFKNWNFTTGCVPYIGQMHNTSQLNKLLILQHIYKILIYRIRPSLHYKYYCIKVFRLIVIDTK